MDCKEFDSLIKPMLTESFSVETEADLEKSIEFYEHIFECPECYDLFEAYVIAQASKEGKFDLIENGSPSSVVSAILSYFDTHKSSYEAISKQKGIHKDTMLAKLLIYAFVSSPNHPIVFQLFMSIYENYDGEDKITTLEAMASKQKKSFILQFLAASFNARERRFERAIEFYIKSLEAAPDSPLVVFTFNDLAVCQYIVGQKDKALASIDTGIKIDPNLEYLQDTKDKFLKLVEPSMDLFKPIAEVIEECQRYMKAA